MDFSEALRRLKLGAKLHRLAWESATRALFWMQLSEDGTSLELHFYHGAIQRWGKSTDMHSDILADDWVDPAE